jgi:hypothetical protein
MTSARLSALALAAVVLATAATPIAAQVTFPNVRLNGRLQEQFYYFGNEDYAATTGPKSNFFTRRARIEARGQINEYVTVFIQPSFEGGRSISGSNSCKPIIDDQTGGPDTLAVSCTFSGTGGVRLRDAWIDVRLNKPEAKTALTVRFGQEKRPFSRYELTSSNNLPSMERGGGRGLLASQSNDLFGAAGLLAHDVGMHARLEHKIDATGRMASILVGVYNGRGESVLDNNNAKSIGVRGYADFWKKLSIGGSFFSHDNIVGTDSAFRNSGYGVDVQWSRVGEEGFYGMAEWLQGKDASAAKNKIRGIQAVAAYNYRLTSPTSWLYAIEPAVRFDFADPNTASAKNGSTLITGVVGFYMSSRAQFRVGVEHQSFQASGAKSITGVRSAMTVSF